MKDRHTHGEKMARKGHAKVIYKFSFVSNRSIYNALLKWTQNGSVAKDIIFSHTKGPNPAVNSFSWADRLTTHGSDLMPVGKSDVFRDRAILSPL